MPVFAAQEGGTAELRTRAEKCLERLCARCLCGFPLFPRSLCEVHSGVKFAFDGRWPHAPHVALSLSHHLAGPQPALRGAGAGGLSKLSSLY